MKLDDLEQVGKTIRHKRPLWIFEEVQIALDHYSAFIDVAKTAKELADAERDGGYSFTEMVELRKAVHAALKELEETG